jgi:hypothetical protein
LLVALELLVRRTPSTKTARADLTLILLHPADLDHSYFDELRVTSPAERAGGLASSWAPCGLIVAALLTGGPSSVSIYRAAPERKSIGSALFASPTDLVG